MRMRRGKGHAPCGGFELVGRRRKGQGRRRGGLVDCGRRGGLVLGGSGGRRKGTMRHNFGRVGFCHNWTLCNNNLSYPVTA